MTDQNSKYPGWPPAGDSGSNSGWPPSGSNPGWPPSSSTPGWPPSDSTAGWPPTDSTAGRPPTDPNAGWQTPPGSPQGMGWAVGQPWQGVPPVQPKRGYRAVLTLVAVGLIATLIVGLAAMGVFNSKDVTATSSVEPDQGVEVFSETFANNGAGWWTGNSGYSDFSFEPGAYKISGSGDLIHFVPSPHEEWYKQISVTMTASQAAGQPDEAGFGVYCVREDYGSASGSSRLAYEFLVLTDGSWTIDKRSGEASTESSPDPVASGRGAPAASTTPITIQAVCATVDSRQTRLILFVNGKMVGEGMDSVTIMPDELWEGGILVASAGGVKQSVAVTSYVERNLQK